MAFRVVMLVVGSYHFPASCDGSQYSVSMRTPRHDAEGGNDGSVSAEIHRQVDMDVARTGGFRECQEKRIASRKFWRVFDPPRYPDKIQRP